MVVSVTNVPIHVWSIRLVGFLVRLTARLQTRDYDYDICDLIQRSLLNCASADVAIQRSAEIDWKPGGTDDHWYYYAFEAKFVHDVPTGMVHMWK